MLLVVYGSVGCRGAADRTRGRLLSVLGRHDEAVAALDAAVALEERVGGTALLPRTWSAHAEVLLARDHPDDAGRARALLDRAEASAVQLGVTGVLREISAARQRLR